MPRWLIILLVVFLVFFLGCCGGWVACNWMCARVSQTVGAGVTAGLEAATREAEARMRAETQRMAEEAARDATREGGAPAGGGGGGGAGGGGGGVEGGGGIRGGGALPGLTAKLPDNFPSDLPFYSGLTPRFTTSDKVKNTGAVIFEGKGDKAPVVSFYEKEMEKQGWKIEQNIDMGNGTIMVFSKNARKATLQVTSEQGNINGTITYESPQ